jgi:hypothetical protein
MIIDVDLAPKQIEKGVAQLYLPAHKQSTVMIIHGLQSSRN